MASYALDEFLGEGQLKDLGPKFAEDGWDDVPTIKVIGAEDMEALELTDAERVIVATILRPFAPEFRCIPFADSSLQVKA